MNCWRTKINLVLPGFVVGGVFQLLNFLKIGDFKEEEMMDPTVFFLVMLPPIIFESGYSLHKVGI